MGARSGLRDDPPMPGDIGERRRGDSGGSDASPLPALNLVPADPGVVVGAASSGDDRGEGSGGLCFRARGGEISSSPSLSTTAMRRAGVSSSSSMSSPMLSSRSKLASA